MRESGCFWFAKSWFATTAVDSGLREEDIDAHHRAQRRERLLLALKSLSMSRRKRKRRVEGPREVSTGVGKGDGATVLWTILSQGRERRVVAREDLRPLTVNLCGDVICGQLQVCAREGDSLLLVDWDSTSYGH
jgi:hypothetical protein